MNIREKFTRTHCDCENCRRPCRHMPGMLVPGDVERIAEQQGVTVATIESKLSASPGAVAGRVLNGRVVMVRVPTIVPSTNERGCVFLTEDGKCSIHEVSPFGCAYYDWHISHEEADSRTAAALYSIAKDEHYQNTWKRLADAGRMAEDPQVLRQRIAEEYEQAERECTDAR